MTGCNARIAGIGAAVAVHSVFACAISQVTAYRVACEPSVSCVLLLGRLVVRCVILGGYYALLACIQHLHEQPLSPARCVV
jgi:hypothetical protein